jgi:hypothetical protein
MPLLPLVRLTAGLPLLLAAAPTGLPDPPATRDRAGSSSRPERADSLGAGAAASIELCRPPQWFGTAHTHVARYDGVRPYPDFSGADRGVMRLWWKRWRVGGTFCVLYSGRDAHCGAWSTARSRAPRPGPTTDRGRTAG